MSRGRSPGFRMGAEHRGKIKNSNILKCLIEHATGEREMSSTQVQAGLGLLKKVMPDITYSESDNTHRVELPDEIIIRGYNPDTDG